MVTQAQHLSKGPSRSFSTSHLSTSAPSAPRASLASPIKDSSLPGPSPISSTAAVTSPSRPSRLLARSILRLRLLISRSSAAAPSPWSPRSPWSPWPWSHSPGALASASMATSSRSQLSLSSSPRQLTTLGRTLSSSLSSDGNES